MLQGLTRQQTFPFKLRAAAVLLHCTIMSGHRIRAVLLYSSLCMKGVEPVASAW